MEYWVKIFQIVSKYNNDGDPITAAEHDIIYFNLTEEECPEDSEDGEALDKLRCHLEDGYWAIYV